MSDSAEHASKTRSGSRFPALEAAIESVRKNDFAFVLLMLLLVTLNLLDFAFTSQFLAAGYREANPLMNYLFKQDPMAAGIFKMSATFAFAFFAWPFRRHRPIILTCFFAVGLYVNLFVYHLMGTVLFIR